MNISSFPVSPFVENTYIIWDKTNGDAAIVDPGMMRDDERQMVDSFIANNGLSVKYILITHVHIDHVASARWAADKYGAKILGNKIDEQYAAILPEQAAYFRLKLDIEPFAFDQYIEDGDEIRLADEMIRVLFTPGHSAGSLSFYLPDSNFIITGDTLFEGSIGRTDLPGGNYNTIIHSIKNKLLTLPSDAMIYPGHGPSSTIGDELRYNPYL